MSSRKLENISWYVDEESLNRGEPGIRHSFVAALATALDYIDGSVDPTWLMGTSGFAFRIFVNEIMCPSAYSIFNWNAVLPEAVRRSGHECLYISRLWHENDKENQRRMEAEEAVMQNIDNGFPAVVWDIHEAEWGLIVGYDTNKKFYNTISHNGKSLTLPFEKLGKNGIDILSVAIPGQKVESIRNDIIQKSLFTAVAHAEQKEWTDRPKYQDGLPAFDLWAVLYKRWAKLAEAGKEKDISTNIRQHAFIYAAMYFSARCFARDYLAMIADGNEALLKASSEYSKAAENLKPMWEHFSARKAARTEMLRKFSEDIKAARVHEAAAVEAIKEYLG